MVMNTKTDPICEVCREHPVFKDSLCAECAEIEGETLRREYNELRAEIERLKAAVDMVAEEREAWKKEAIFLRVGLRETVKAGEAWKTQVERLRAALERLVDIGPSATLKEWRGAQTAGAQVLGR